MIQSSAFKGDPYGHSTNQFGHAFVVGAIGFVYAVVLVCWYLAGEFPPKWSIIAGAAVAYAIFELLTQGWRGWDTAEDWVIVVVYGVGGPTYSFTELEPGQSKAIFDLLAALPFITMLFVHIGLGAWLRSRQK